MRPRDRLHHPLFLGALALLALNDHVLKGAGVLPGAVTGKLSDVAGLLVAPLVCAWLLRVRTTRGWTLAHVAVGLGFALQELPIVTHSIHAHVGVCLVADATDLLALPALLVSHRVLGRPREAPASPRGAGVIGLVALAFCTATSGLGEPPPRYPFPPAGILETDVFVRHVASEDLTIAVRRLRDETEVDCAELLDPPPRLLDGDDFGEEQEWTLARGDAIPLWDRRGGAVDRECYAVILKARDHEWLITWRRDAPPVLEHRVRLEVGEPIDEAAVQIANDGADPPRAPQGVTVRPRE